MYGKFLHGERFRSQRKCLLFRWNCLTISRIDSNHLSPAYIGKKTDIDCLTFLKVASILVASDDKLYAVSFNILRILIKRRLVTQ